MADIAWIGLGHMGGPMTANLVRAGHNIKGFDLGDEALSAAAEQGVQSVASIREAVVGAEAVFTMLPKSEHVSSAYLDAGGTLS